MGEEQPRADRNGASGTGEPPDVIDLRPPTEPAHTGSPAPEPTNAAAARFEDRALSASEGWEWLDLGLRISDAQLAARRTTSRPMNIDRTDVRVRPGPNGTPEPAASQPDQPAIELPESTNAGSARSDWLTWMRLGRTISGAQRTGLPVNGDPARADEDVEPASDGTPAQVAEDAPGLEVEPEVAGEPTEPAVVATRTEGRRGVQLAWKPLASLVAVVVLVAAVAIALATRDGKPVQGGPSRPSASVAPRSAAAKSFAVTWLEQNTAPGTRLLVPPELVNDFAAGLPGRQVLPNDDTAVRNGDLVVVTPDSGDVLEGTLTQQVLASAPVVARLPGSDLDVRLVTRPDASGDAARAAAGSQLLQNLGLTFVAGSAAALRSGQVDERLLVILAGLAAQHSLRVALLHDPADAPDAQVRTLQIDAVDGHPLSAAGAREIAAFVTVQRGALAGPVVQQTQGTANRAISVRYLLPDSVDLLSGGSFPTIPQESP